LHHQKKMQKQFSGVDCLIVAWGAGGEPIIKIEWHFFNPDYVIDFVMSVKNGCEISASRNVSGQADIPSLLV
jgi:hypothetical protein